MNDLETILDDCLTQVASGAWTVDECLKRYPKHAAELKALLQNTAPLDLAQSIGPSPVFRARARGQLTNYMKAHPRRRSRGGLIAWRMAVSWTVLVLALFATGTAFAQGALPGQALYSWKLYSEHVWRAVASDPVAVDLMLADRRVAEMTASAGDSAAEAQAQSGYLEVLARLQSESDAQNQALILQKLQSHQEKLSGAGISIPGLDQYLSAPNSKPANTSPGSTRPSNTPGPNLPPPALTARPPLPPQALTAMPKTNSPIQVP